MKYYLLNPENPNEPIVIKVNSVLENIVSKMVKLSRKHAELDKQLVKELARINNISEDEASDIMCFNDFLVDSSQYGLGEVVQQISKEQYDKYRKEQ